MFEVSITFDRTVYVAGTTLTGSVLIRNLNSNSTYSLDICFSGKEEIIEEGKCYRTTFLEMKQQIGEQSLLDKKKAIVPFRIEIPANVSSSYSSLKSVIKYTADVVVVSGGEQVLASKDCLVVECLSADESRKLRLPSFGRSRKRVAFGGSGELDLQCQLHKSYYKSGDTVYVTIFVQNNSKRKVSGVKLALFKRTILKHRSDDKFIKEKLVLEKDFTKEDYRFYQGEAKEILVDFPLPSDLRRVNKAATIEVNFFLKVSLILVLSKNCTIEMPIEICHPATIEPPPAPGVFRNRMLSTVRLPDAITTTTDSDESSSNRSTSSFHTIQDDLPNTQKMSVALEDFETSEDGELSMKRDDFIELNSWEGDWWEGRNLTTNLVGKFPQSFVQIL